MCRTLVGTVVALGLYLWANVPATRALDLDPIPLTRLPPGTPLRWDNVRSAPVWVAGAQPCYDKSSRWHLVTLAPGQHVTIRLPPQAMLRLAAPRYQLAPGDLEVWISHGSGLYRQLSTAVAAQDHSLIAVPDLAESGLARIECPARGGDSLQIALFTSRRIALTWDEGFLKPLLADGPTVDLRVGAARQRFVCNVVQPGEVVRMPVCGPGRLRLETRLQYPPGESEGVQPYRLMLTIDGGPRRVVELETGSESRQVIYVNDVPCAVGRGEIEYVELPAGNHTLAVESSACVYLYTLASTARSTASSLNPYGEVCLPGSSSGLSLWDTPDAVFAQQLRTEPPDLDVYRTAALRSARDRRFREGGLRAWWLLKTLASSRPELPALGQLAQRTSQFHTSYRNLLPAQQSTWIEPRAAWSLVRPLNAADDDRRQAVLAEQFIDDALGTLSLARFVRCPPGRATEAVYSLPTDLGATQLRVLVDLSGPPRAGRVWLSFDGRPPVALRVLSEPVLARAEYATTRADAGLAALHWRHPRDDAGTLGGPFALQHAPADLVPVGVAELTLPQGAQRVHLVAEPGGNLPLDVCLQYRASRRYDLTESAYLASWRQAGGDGMDVLASLEGAAPSPGIDRAALLDLQNQWLPLAAWLESQQQAYVAELAPPAAHRSAPTPAAESDLQSELQQARRLTESGDWMLSLESWSRLLPRTTGSLRCEVLRERTRALEQLQEPYLVDRELRGMVCFDADPEVRAMARQYLRDRYEREDDLEHRQGLAAASLFQERSPEHLQEVVRLLLRDGQWSLALTAGLGLAPAQRDTEGLLLAACQLRWWQVYEELLSRLPSAESQHYWQAIRQLYQGQDDQAEQHLLLAGARGQQMVSHLIWGRQILQQLRSPRLAQRLFGVVAWENWQQSQPGPRVWQLDDQSVVRCAGTASVYVVARDQYAQYYLAQPTQPVWLEVQGPVDLQLEARPLHDTRSYQALHDELMVRGAGREHLFAINSNRPSVGLQVVEQLGRAPGERIIGTVVLGPGRHRLQVAASRADVLVRVRVRRAACPLPVLPPLTRDTVRAVMEGVFGQVLAVAPGGNSPSHRDEPATIQLIRTNGSVVPESVSLVRQACVGVVSRPADAQEMSALLQARWAFRLGGVRDAQVDALVNWAAAGGSVDEAAERYELLLQYAADPCPLIAARGLPITPYLEQAVRMQRGQIDAALAVDPGQDVAACQQRLALLTRLAEGDAQRRAAYLVLAADQMDRVPWLSDLTGIEARLMRNADWSLYREVQSSAGVHAVTPTGWSPEAPGLRIRRVLFSQPEPADYLLSGTARLRLQLSSTRSAITQITLVRPQLSYLLPTPVSVVWQLNNQPAQRVVLDQPHVAHPLRVTLPAGDHQIQLQLEDPAAGQFILVRLHEIGATNQQLPWKQQPDAAREQRLYHVATIDQPLRFRVTGPARIRVDELAGTSTRTRYFNVSDGEQRFELSPAPGVEMALFRIFELQWSGAPARPTALPPVTQPPVPLPVWLDQLPLASPQPVQVVAPAWFAAPAAQWGDPVALQSLASPDDPARWIDLPDAFPLGGQEKGTWAFASGAFHRRPVDEDFQKGAPDEFIDLRLWYDQYAAATDANYRTASLFRLRDASGPTWGLTHQQWWEWPSGDAGQSRALIDRRGLSDNWTLNWDVYGFLQPPAGALPPHESQLEGSIGSSLCAFRRLDLTERTWQLPAATVFGRWLSLDEVSYEPGHVDQDVFTVFKSDHRTGLRLSDTWVHQPRLDTQLWLRSALMTNEDYDVVRPDHVTLQTGCATYVSDVILDLHYRATHYRDDGDRSDSITQQFLGCDALLEHWLHAGCRYELGLSVRHELTEGETSANLVLIRYFSAGRGYRDMPPGTVDFRALRQQRHLTAWLQEYAQPN